MTVGKLFKSCVGDTAGLPWEGRYPRQEGQPCQASEPGDRVLGPYLKHMKCWTHGLSSRIALLEGVWCTK